MVNYNTFVLATVKILGKKIQHVSPLTEDGAFVWKASFLLGQSEEKPNLYLPGNKLANVHLHLTGQHWVHGHRCMTHLFSI